MWTLSKRFGLQSHVPERRRGGVGHSGCSSTEDVTASGEPVSGFTPGWCGTHVVQHQKPDPAKDNYEFDISLFDHVGVPIGGGERGGCADRGRCWGGQPPAECDGCDGGAGGCVGGTVRVRGSELWEHGSVASL